MKLVSIVVVTYKSSQTVLETLDSIYDQTYVPVELIIADDASPDDTVEICERWIESHADRFRGAYVIKSEKNTGVTCNCNRGLFASKGEYVQFIAGDDLLLPSAVETKVTYAEKNGENLVISKTEPFGDNLVDVEHMKVWLEKGYNTIEKGYEEQLNQILFYDFVAGPSGSFFRKQFLIDFGGFDERYPMVEDYPFLFHYLLAGNELHLLGQVLSRYRLSSGSLSGSSNSPMWKCHWVFFFRERFRELWKRKRYQDALYLSFYHVYRRFIKGSFVGDVVYFLYKKVFHLQRKF